jgi:hypothetical protein
MNNLKHDEDFKEKEPQSAKVIFEKKKGPSKQFNFLS